jgi:hypothetical protein
MEEEMFKEAAQQAKEDEADEYEDPVEEATAADSTGSSHDADEL